MQKQIILVLGNGGREHALCYALIKSGGVDKIYCAAGNAGISLESPSIECVAFDITCPQTVLEFSKLHHVDLVVIGSEAPAASGVADLLSKHNIKVFGCSKKAAMLEASKTFTKQICEKLNVPTARSIYTDNLNDALTALDQFQAPYVLKADGLAAGKGVVIAQNLDDAKIALHNMFDGAFGSAGHRVVIEEFLEGEEASFFVLSDGRHAIPFGTAQDHKRAYDNDQGPNTGGMGAYSPATILTDALQSQVMDTIITPVIQEMDAQKTPFVGVLYAGLMLTNAGPKLIEFNVRFGDPECQVLMMRLKSDLLPILNAVATGALNTILKPQWHSDYAVTIVRAAHGYPDQKIIKGTAITLPQNNGNNDTKIFHAGTSFNDQGTLIANGGRVLNITAKADTITKATEQAYEIIKAIHWPESFYRQDIAYKEIKRQKN